MSTAKKVWIFIGIFFLSLFALASCIVSVRPAVLNIDWKMFDAYGFVADIFMLLYNYRYIVWAFWIIVYAVIIVLLATSPARRHKKYKKQLLQTFQFYGEKYDAEDADKDF